jgi:hypothetical protein
VLIHQATEKIAQQNATVYAVKPYFQEGLLSFQVQLSGAPEGFNLNASTTIAAGSIGTDPEPNLVLVPKNIKTQVPKSAEETALIIAVTFNPDNSIAYHVQLNDGTVVKVYGDNYVHDIDLIDPYAPPILSILTSHTLSHMERDTIAQYERATTSTGVEPMPIEKRGVEGITSNTATFSKDTCRRIKCLNNGGKPALFNPFLNSCQCQTLVQPGNGFTKRTKGSASDMTEELAGLGTGISFIRSLFSIDKPSLKTCRRLIACHDESKPYFDEATSQCLCVVYRPGVKEPVIVSDTTVLPRAESAEAQDRKDSLANTAKALAHGVISGAVGPEKHCRQEFAEKYCLAGMVGRWNEDFNSCVCVTDIMPEKPEDGEHTSNKRAASSVEPSLEKRIKWYLRCTDNLIECLSDPYHYRCDSNQKMVKHEQNTVCEDNCECGGINLGACLNPRGGCSFTRPDHPGLGPEDREVRSIEYGSVHNKEEVQGGEAAALFPSPADMPRGGV